MSEETKTPDQQETPPVQPATETPPDKTGQDNTNWKARADGLVRKVEELTLAKRELEGQLAAKSSEIERLEAQLAIKDQEKTVAVNERDKKYEELLTTNTQTQAELDSLRALKLKLEVATDIGNLELLKIAEHLPNLTDKEALTTVMQDFAKFGQDQVKAREQQLLSGVLPTTGGSSTEPTKPTSQKQWEKHINSLPLGSRERATAVTEMGEWLRKEHS